jgi:hypothetical protein
MYRLVTVANRLLTGWSLVRIRPGEPKENKYLGQKTPPHKLLKTPLGQTSGEFRRGGLRITDDQERRLHAVVVAAPGAGFLNSKFSRCSGSASSSARNFH